MAEPDGTREGRAAALAPRLTLLVVSVVFAGFVVNAFQYVVTQRATVGHIAPAAFCLAVMMALQLGFFSNPNADLRGPRAYAALLVQALVALVPLATYGTGWTGLQGFLAGDVLLVLRPLASWLVFAVIALTNGFVQYQFSWSLLGAAYIANLTAVIGLVVFGLSRLRLLVKELDETRARLAGLAVARERLRFARDLHDLLGYSLSAITLKAELTQRIVTRIPDRARQELTEILEVSRQALADVRSVAASYRELSLEDALASAQSMLTATGITVTATGTPGPLPPNSRTVLATVLREGITNLRHASPTHCEITVTRTASEITLRLTNDGVSAATSDGGQGLGNLRTRVEELGGTLTSASDPAGTFRLAATLPLREQHALSARAGSLGPGVGLLVAAVVLGYGINAVVLAVAAEIGGWQTAAAIGCVVFSVAVVVGVFSRPTGPQGVAKYGLLAGLALATYGPILVFGNPYLGTSGLLAGCLLVALKARTSLPLFVGVMASMGVIQYLFGENGIGVTYGVLLTVNHGLVVFALTRLRSMIRDLHDARSELAELALAQERGRFANDLHELLGSSLSAITLKAELTQRLVAADPDRAVEETTEIIGISRQALADVRAVAASYKEL